MAVSGLSGLTRAYRPRGALTKSGAGGRLQHAGGDGHPGGWANQLGPRRGERCDWLRRRRSGARGAEGGRRWRLQEAQGLMKIHIRTNEYQRCRMCSN
eukprot:4731764-Pyramimonas_sp.AAC.1